MRSESKGNRLQRTWRNINLKNCQPVVRRRYRLTCQVNQLYYEGALLGHTDIRKHHYHLTRRTIPLTVQTLLKTIAAFWYNYHKYFNKNAKQFIFQFEISMAPAKNRISAIALRLHHGGIELLEYNLMSNCSPTYSSSHHFVSISQ